MLWLAVNGFIVVSALLIFVGVVIFVACSWLSEAVPDRWRFSRARRWLRRLRHTAPV